MATPPVPISPDLDEAGHALRQVLLRLNHYAQKQVQRADASTPYGAATLAHVTDLHALLTAVEQYEHAVLANISLAPGGARRLTPTQLLAYQEADPLYQLGYERGYKRGTEQGEQARERALSVYAQHAALPKPANCSALVKRVSLLLQFQQDPTRLSATRLETLQQQLAKISYDHAADTLYGTY
jgi:hypothetical protein